VGVGVGQSVVVEMAFVKTTITITTEIVVVGAGEKLDKPLPKATVDWLAKQGIAVEQMDTVRREFWV
jgi:uncharacterized protein